MGHYRNLSDNQPLTGIRHEEEPVGCSPFRPVKKVLGSVATRLRLSKSVEQPVEPIEEKKYVHVPTHAASDFLSNATSRPIRKSMLL